MPWSRRRALIGLATALADGDLVLDTGVMAQDEIERRLLALPGIGPWTVAYIAMRALRDAGRVHADRSRRSARPRAPRTRRQAAERRAHRGALAPLPCVRDAAPVGPAPLVTSHGVNGHRSTPAMTTTTHTPPRLYTYIRSPIGRLLLCGDEERLTGLYTLPAAENADLVRWPAPRDTRRSHTCATNSRLTSPASAPSSTSR